MQNKIQSEKPRHRAGRRHNPPAESAHEMAKAVPTTRVFWGWDRKVAAVPLGSKVLKNRKRRETNPTEPDISVVFPGDITQIQAVRLLETVKHSICMGGWPGTTEPMWTDLEAARPELVDRALEAPVSGRGGDSLGKYSRQKRKTT
jgi:hypothetical protein